MALNAAAFAPDALNTAKGFGPNSAESNGGIVMPVRVHLALGQRYFRFANSAMPIDRQIAGGWWIEYETFAAIVRFAREHSEPGHAARYLLALPFAWTACDVLVTAILEAPLDAYRGQGKPARGDHPDDRGTIFIPPQHLYIQQLYIPGLAPVRGRAFPQVETASLADSAYFKVRDR